MTWPSVLLGEVATFLNGGTPSRAKPEFFEGNIPWITGADVPVGDKFVNTSRSYISNEGVSQSATNLVPAGTVLLVTRTGVGKAAIAGVDLAFSQDITAVVHDPQRVDRDFLLHALRHESHRYKSLAQGATIKGITREVVESTVLPLPSIEEQRRIASILDAADALRTKRRQALEKLDSLTQSIFIDMFGDPISNPKGWTMRPFNELCPSHLGKMLDQKKQTGLHLRPYVRNTNVRWFKLDLNDVAQMDFDDRDRPKYRLEPGDVLICEGGEPGRAAVWRGELSECYFQKAVHRGRPAVGLATSDFVVHLLAQLARRGGLVDHISSATIAHLTGERLKSMLVIAPPVALQQAFSSLVNQLDGADACASESLARLDSLFASLQHRAFRGEL